MIRTNAVSVKKISQIASQIREQYNVRNNSFFPILTILDKLMLEGKVTYQIVEDSNPILNSDTPALYNAIENYIYIKESVLDEYEEGNYRSAFTLCHEFFHYLQAQVLCFSFNECDECKPYENIEWQANEFAGQLLIPEDYVDLSEYDIAKMFHVTLECALTRKINAKKRRKC